MSYKLFRFGREFVISCFSVQVIRADDGDIVGTENVTLNDQLDINFTSGITPETTYNVTVTAFTDGDDSSSYQGIITTREYRTPS